MTFSFTAGTRLLESLISGKQTKADIFSFIIDFWDFFNVGISC